MGRILFLLALLGSTFLLAQAQEIQADIFEHLKADALILTEAGLIKGEDSAAYVAEFEASIGAAHSYTKDFSIEVNAKLEYEIGEIQSTSNSYAVMFLKTKGDDGAQIEFLILYEKSDSERDLSALDKAREAWMELCNTHQVEELVEQLYVPDSYYYNRGRLLQGTKALSSEYGYMKNPQYSLKLTPKHILSVNSVIAYELGQCSGSYPLPYLLVWEKQEDGEWKILLDSNY